jgi:hypothetical protein
MGCPGDPAGEAKRTVRTPVTLTSEEIRRLKRLRGQPVDSLWTDGWAVHLKSAGRTFGFLPEEVGVEDVFHPDADVVRLRVEEEPHLPLDAPPLAELSGSLGRVLRLAVVSTAVATSPPVLAHPDAIEADGAGPDGSGRAVALVDVGIALELEGGWTVIATDGTEFAVYAALPGRTEERLAALAGRVRLTPLLLAPAAGTRA